MNIIHWGQYVMLIILHMVQNTLLVNRPGVAGAVL